MREPVPVRPPDPSIAHPVNALIRELFRTGRIASPAEFDAILARIAEAPFNEKLVDVDPDLVGTEFLGATLRAREPSIRAHLAKRILTDAMWSVEASPEDYLEDIRGAARHPSARLAIYRDGKRIIAAIVSQQTTPLIRRGIGAGAAIVAIYDSGRGRLITGYHLTSEASLNLSEDIQWQSRS
jgi:hypothetical protein